MYRAWIAVALLAIAPLAPISVAAEQRVNGQQFTLPDGLVLELAAGAPLVERPISADFDELGRLYVTESSGTNDIVQQQLAERPHRILRLEDTDGDGRYDRRTVFAEKMMFPEGATWLAGSLYVCAPPQIWKLTDTDDDGVADRREVWFDGKTLTGCANDLHGPYRGPDGWIYWCKGAFAEQTYERPGRKPLVTRASHIFRRRPEGGPIEAVMTGGMDNPVEVVFTGGGERIFTTTFLQHPGGGRRDGLIHALYGGVYGKRHSVLEGHPHTGELLPPLIHLGAAAPCGLARLESNALASDAHRSDERDRLVAALFNLHKVTRHVLVPQGATFATRDEDLLVGESLDFHPTDVLEDADGSLLVVDTGGWYKLCCPTSQLWKPDVLGAIYRIRRQGARPVDDPWGKKLDWAKAGAATLVARLRDRRAKVCQRAGDALVRLGEAAVAPLQEIVESNGKNTDDVRARTAAVWTLARIEGEPARAAVRAALDDTDETVRQTALHAVSIRRDAKALPALLKLLASDSSHNRRAAAEALGQLGDVTAVPALLTAAGDENDRMLDHSLTYALIEIGDAGATQRGLTSKNLRTRRAALVALDQMEGDHLRAEQVVGDLDSDDAVLRHSANWIIGHHPQWAPELVGFFRRQLGSNRLDNARREELVSQLALFASDADISRLLAQNLADPATAKATRQVVLTAMSKAARDGLDHLSDGWAVPLAALVAGDDRPLSEQAIATVRSFSKRRPHSRLDAALLKRGRDGTASVDVRLEALAAVAGGLGEVDEATFELLIENLPADRGVNLRGLAVEILTQSKLSAAQHDALAQSLPKVGPLELERVLATAARGADVQLSHALLAQLRQTPAAASLPADKLRAMFARSSPEVRDDVARLLAELETSTSEQRQRLESLLADLPPGDVRRGQKVFHDARASCIACHAMGYLGGNIGPDLTRIGGIRSERDLLEAVLYPSASFVRSYEPVNVVTTDGQVLSGLVREDNGLELVLVTSDRKQVRLRRDEIDELSPSTVSIMPAGLDKQLTPQELADLIRFLKAAK